jgi:hypothetical protein
MRFPTDHVLAIACAGFVSQCSAQTGTVTFYSIQLSAGQQAKVALSPVGTVAFTGWLFDGDKKLVHAARGRFMTFQLPAGPHDFSTPYKSKGPGKKPCAPMDCLHLEVGSGSHYCVRLSAKDVNTIVIPLSFVNSRIEQVSCHDAFQEAGKYKRIDLKRVDSGAQALLDPSMEFPRDN